MKKVTLLLIACLLMLAGFSYAQTTIPDGGDLQAALAAATPGDILELVDGGIYMSDEIILDREITIKAADGAAVRPTIIATGSTTFSFGRVGGTPYGVKLQGIRLAAHVPRARIFSFGREDTISHIIMSDIVAHDYGAAIIRAAEGGQPQVASLDSLLVENSYFYDFAWDQRESSFYLDRGDIETRYIKLYNSSFDGFFKKFLDCGAQQNKKTVIIDHINVVREDPKSVSRDEDLFEIRGDSGQYSSITITNSIFGHQIGALLFDFSQEPTAVIDSMYNCHFFDIDTTGTMYNEWAYINNWVESDPLFSHDSVNAMYLTAGSPALTASTIGGPIGDSRWWVLPDAASLSDLEFSIPGQYLRPMFRSDHYTYTATVPYPNETFEIIASANFQNATITGDGEISLVAGATETFNIVVTAEDGVTTQTYTIELTRTAPETDATLSELMLRTKTDTFNVIVADVFDYGVNIPLGSDTVWIEPTASSSLATLTYPELVEVSIGSYDVEIIVLAEDTITTNTYTVTIQLCGTGTDASLSDLTLDGTILDGFDPGTFTYDVVLEQGTTAPPEVGATATDPEAEVIITQPVDVNDAATIVVNATDCEHTATYTINFSVNNTGVDIKQVSNLYMVHNSDINQLSIFNAGDVELVTIYSITGKLLISQTVASRGSLEIGTGNLPNGMYLVRMKSSANEVQTGKFIK